MEEEANNVRGCKERNFWNCWAKVLGSMIDPDEITIAVLWCGGL
jgi:hypothetical protein